MLALVEIVQQVRLLSLLERGDPLAVTIRDQCLAALDGNRSEALAFLAGCAMIELSRPDATVAAIGQIQQALRCVESKDSARGRLLSLREGSEPARDVRLPHRKEFFFALQNAIRIGIALSAGAIFLVLAGWPASALALTITAIVCALSTTMPDPSKVAVAAMVSFALAAVSADIVHFYLLTEVAGLHPTCDCDRADHDFWLFVQRQSEDRRHRADHERHFPFLAGAVQPSTFNPLSFFSQCMFVAFALGVVFLASRLVWPVSGLDKQRAVVRATEETLAASVTGDEIQPASAEHSRWPPGSPTTLPRLLTNKGRVRKCLRAFSRPTTCRSRRLRPTFIWSRARTIRPSARGLARCNELFSPAIAGGFTPAQINSSTHARKARPGCRRHVGRGNRSIVRGPGAGAREAQDPAFLRPGLHQTRRRCDGRSAERQKGDQRSRCSDILRPACLSWQRLLPRAMAGSFM